LLLLLPDGSGLDGPLFLGELVGPYFVNRKSGLVPGVGTMEEVILPKDAFALSTAFGFCF
jgi:hypothetical protein